MTAAHAGSPLAEKLDLKRGVRAWFADLPDDVRAALGLDRLGVDEQQAPSAGLEYVHLFPADRAMLQRQLAAVRELIEPAAFVWVSWLGQDAPGELDADAIRAVAAPLGLTDVATCAVSDSWCGLKLMIRRSLA